MTAPRNWRQIPSQELQSIINKHDRDQEMTLAKISQEDLAKYITILDDARAEIINLRARNAELHSLLARVLDRKPDTMIPLKLLKDIKDTL